MTADNSVDEKRLLAVLAEQLKLPVTQMSRLVELKSHDQELIRQINETSEIALQLIDGVILSINTKSQTSLNLEPICLSRVLRAAADDLVMHAKKYDCELELDISSNYNPVMGNFRAYKSAFTTLGYTLVESQYKPGGRVVIKSYKQKDKIYAGIFSDNKIDNDSFKRAKILAGSARQPLSKNSSSSAGIFIADSIFSALATNLDLVRRRNLTGFVTSFVPSKQLELV